MAQHVTEYKGFTLIAYALKMAQGYAPRVTLKKRNGPIGPSTPLMCPRRAKASRMKPRRLWLRSITEKVRLTEGFLE